MNKGDDMQGAHARLGLNELPYKPADSVVKAAQLSCEEANRYPSWDMRELRTAIADFWDISSDWVVVGSGSASVIQQMMIASGQGEIAFGWPSFDAFPAIAKGLRMPVREVKLTEDGSCDLDDMLRAITPRTTMVIVCTPNTPTGGILTQAELKKFVEKVPPQVLVLIDEAYGEFVRDDQAVRAMELVALHPNVAMSRTFSKVYGMAGFRVGYLLAQPELAARIRACGIPFSVSLPAQAAAIAALANEAEAASRIDSVIAERERMARLLRELGAEVMVGHGNFVWLPVGDLAKQVADKLQAHGVIVKALVPHGVRISVGTPQETDQLCDAWKKANPLYI